ncbi:MAG: secondary thiamine-phosphate synthase enzyme YjbQ [Desulfurococcales archaeon]|nr:secondary thiamine-phosphate synthase enzyme YjbQ [Desulfurococcales archaeon]
MRVASGEVVVETRRRIEVVDVTGLVEKWLSGVSGGDGLLIVRVPHTTAAVTINEAEPGLLEDIVRVIEEYFRPGGDWMHNRIDNNAHAHLAASFIGDSRVVPVSSGRLQLGTWQRILLVEGDGPRRRRLQLLYIGE